MAPQLSWNTSNAAKLTFTLKLRVSKEKDPLEIKINVKQTPKMSYETLFELPVTLLYPWCDFAHCLITALQARKDQKGLFRYDQTTQKRV